MGEKRTEIKRQEVSQRGACCYFMYGCEGRKISNFGVSRGNSQEVAGAE